MQEGEDYDDEDEDELCFSTDNREVFSIPEGICAVASSTTKHYAHAECLEQLSAGHGISCPRCLDLRARCAGGHSNPSVDKKFYCRGEVDGFSDGFATSPKLEAVVEWALAVPKDEKMICLSFFKGSLDLIEAIMYHEYGWTVRRFDGDLDPESKTAELDSFKADPKCRLLLMTVQSGGVGLNIVEANHICFVDRWL